MSSDLTKKKKPKKMTGQYHRGHTKNFSWRKSISMVYNFCILLAIQKHWIVSMKRVSNIENMCPTMQGLLPKELHTAHQGKPMLQQLWESTVSLGHWSILGMMHLDFRTSTFSIGTVSNYVSSHFSGTRVLSSRWYEELKEEQKCNSTLLGKLRRLFDVCTCDTPLGISYMMGGGTVLKWNQNVCTWR